MKPFLSLEQQVQKLRDNGLSLTDAEAADARQFLQELERSSERFVQHYKRLGEPVPIWAAVETFSLGTSSRLYGLIADADGVYKPLAERFGISHRASRKVFRSMSVLRNVCAHHGRIWNRNHGVDVEAPPPVRSGPDRSIFKDTPWAWVVTLGYLTDQVRGDASFSDSLWTSSMHNRIGCARA